MEAMSPRQQITPCDQKIASDKKAAITRNVDLSFNPNNNAFTSAQNQAGASPL